TTPIAHEVLLLSHMQYYSYFSSFILLTLTEVGTWVTSFLVEPEETGNMMEVNEPTRLQVLLSPWQQRQMETHMSRMDLSADGVGRAIE
ncbi:MAG: hypothetical protein U0K56_09500, partial [Bacteroidaceae bacterium]|nr:hypothetical protein [Bacteroidaceae bacterium]